MKDRKLYIIIIVLSIIFANILFVKIFISKKDEDYQNLGLDIKEYDIDYYTIYYKYLFDAEYKVYKINNYYTGDSIDKIKEQLESSNIWSKNKFYEYIMTKFYEKSGRKSIDIDREDLYYYHKGLIYAIIDIKNAKLYYLKNNILDYHNDYDEILEIKTQNYIDREIYKVKGQEAEEDGTDYYVYNFNEEQGKDIKETLSKSKKWSNEKLDDEIMDCFEYNDEIYSIQNGYYYYKKICRTRDEYKKEHFKDEEATGYEVGVYDSDKNILYYYWTSI